MNNQRALAHIERVTNIRPILGADNIEQCNVLGWNLITKKGEFHDGDKCVYIQIDSKCPEIPEFEFLRSKDFKVKTMKLGKFNCISQGLALPVTTFPKLALMPEGTDVTNDLGITYYVAEDNVLVVEISFYCGDYCALNAFTKYAQVNFLFLAYELESLK